MKLLGRVIFKILMRAIQDTVTVIGYAWGVFVQSFAMGCRGAKNDTAAWRHHEFVRENLPTLLAKLHQARPAKVTHEAWNVVVNRTMKKYLAGEIKPRDRDS